MKQNFFQRLKHLWSRIWLHPIQVFVFHQVSDVFEPETMWECDWTQTDAFKRHIQALKKKYTFISLTEVQRRLAQDKWRFRNYASLTSDDGWASLTNILPWLVEQKIPVTLFLNPSCLDGKHGNSRETDKLLTRDDVVRIVGQGAPFITIASHGVSGLSAQGQAEYLRGRGLTPVYVDRRVNSRDPALIHRYCIDGGIDHE